MCLLCERQREHLRKLLSAFYTQTSLNIDRTKTLESEAKMRFTETHTSRFIAVQVNV